MNKPKAISTTFKAAAFFGAFSLIASVSQAAFVPLSSPTPEVPGALLLGLTATGGGTVLATLDSPFTNAFTSGIYRSTVVDRDPGAGVLLDFYYQVINTTPIPDIPLEPAIQLPPAAPQINTSTVSPEDVMAAYLSYRRKDAFELLGLEEVAGAGEFTRAWIDFADRFLPTRFDKRAADGLRDKAQEIFLAGSRAYAELADPMRREDLLSRRTKKREQVAAQAAVAESTEVRAKRKAVVDPEEFCRQGQELVEAGKLREALSYFEMAAECDAQNGTYSAEVAFCRFQLLISPAAIALKSLKNAIRIDPRAGLGYLYAGKVLLAMGSRLEAESYIRRAAAMLPRDKRVVDALRSF